MASNTAAVRLTLPSTPESAQKARKKIFQDIPKKDLENWISTQSREITTDPKYADVLENFMLVTQGQHADTCKVWRLLHEARASSDEALRTAKLNRVRELIGNCTVEGLDQNIQNKLRDATSESAQKQAIEAAYDHLTNSAILIEARGRLDGEIQAVMQEKANNEQVPLEERHRRRCCFLI